MMYRSNRNTAKSGRGRLKRVRRARHWAQRFAVIAVALSCAGCGEQTDPRIGNITTELLRNGAAETWLTGGRDWQQSYYSPLTEINQKTVAKLGFAWSYDIDPAVMYQATPVVVDGVMFTSGTAGRVFALDARTGRERWSFIPDIPGLKTLAARSCCGTNNRGVTVWRGKVYVASFDGQLYALDAGSGRIMWKADTILDKSWGYTSTGAPQIAGDKVVIGNGGAEFGARGYITAYDTDTGHMAWRFFTVPGDPAHGFEHPELQFAAKTWDPNSSWASGLGGTVWDGMAYDPALNLLYVGTGNGTPFPRWVRSPSGGDNLFLSSILAIDPDTGRLKWYYQTTPGESWDYTAAQKIILADIRIAGRKRRVLMQAPKNGFFYVLDRETGALISAKPYLRRINWASRVDPRTGRPVETSEADYSATPSLIFPAEGGGHNWHPMAYNPMTGLTYIPVREMGQIFGIRPGPYSY